MTNLWNMALKCILFLSTVGMIGCGDTEKHINPYPVAFQYLDSDLEDFKEALVAYYSISTSGIFKICDLTPGFCDDYYQLEDWVQNYN